MVIYIPYIYNKIVTKPLVPSVFSDRNKWLCKLWTEFRIIRYFVGLNYIFFIIKSHDRGGGLESIKLASHRHFVLKYLYQARRVSSHVFVCYEYRFCLFLRFWYCVLELFRQCGIFCFSFYR